MKFYQRITFILANEGITGLFRRTSRKFFGNSKSPISSNSQIREEKERQYAQLVNDFNEKALAMGYGDLSNYLWYHTIDLGNGLVTPGLYDYRSVLPLFRFPKDMTGMNVLDIGSATGFFAFEFEKRGANVTSVELPSIADWDMSPGEDREQTLKELMAEHHVNTIEELHYFHLDSPFEFCKKVLNSKVKRCHSRIYDLSPEKLGVDAFDLVFLGDVLLHTFSPLMSLVSVAPFCRGTLIISQEMSNLEPHQPMMQYLGGVDQSSDNRTWFLPNKLCFEQMLKRVGFKTVSVVYEQTNIAELKEGDFYRTILHATK